MLGSRVVAVSRAAERTVDLYPAILRGLRDIKGTHGTGVPMEEVHKLTSGTTCGVRRASFRGPKLFRVRHGRVLHRQKTGTRRI